MLSQTVYIMESHVVEGWVMLAGACYSEYVHIYMV